MKKIVVLSLSMMFSSLFISCDNQEDLNSNTSSESSNIASLSRTSPSNVTTLDAVNNIGKEDYFDGFAPSNTAELNYTHGEDKAIVKTGLETNGNYIFDVDGDREVDLTIIPAKPDYSEIYYVDSDGNKISKARFDLDGDNAYVTILEVYTASSKYGQLAKKGKWTACFTGVAGSTAGIAGMVVCNFGGPWCVAGYYAGIAIGCLGA